MIVVNTQPKFRPFLDGAEVATPLVSDGGKAVPAFVGPAVVFVALGVFAATLSGVIVPPHFSHLDRYET